MQWTYWKTLAWKSKSRDQFKARIECKSGFKAAVNNSTTGVLNPGHRAVLTTWLAALHWSSFCPVSKGFLYLFLTFLPCTFSLLLLTVAPKPSGLPYASFWGTGDWTQDLTIPIKHSTIQATSHVLLFVFWFWSNVSIILPGLT